MNEPTREELEAFIVAARFPWGWENLESAARRMAEHGVAEIKRLQHNNRVLTDALWKACGDDKAVVNATIESQGGLE